MTPRPGVVRLLAACALAAAVPVLPVTPASAAPATAAAPSQVVIAAVPGLRWDDVTGGRMPALAALARAGSTGLLSVKSADRVTRCAGGALTLSAGNRVTGGGDACDVRPEALPALRARNDGKRFDARIGALGQALHEAGRRTAAVGPAAALLLADRAGRVDVVAADLGAALRQAAVVAAENEGLYAGDRAALPAVDRWLGDVARQTPPGALLLVVGLSDGPRGRSRLHVVVARGPGFGPGRLVSASTGRAGYVQLLDLAPTVLAGFGVEQPTSMPGRRLERHGRSPADLAAYVDADRHAVRADRLAHSTSLAVVVADLVLLGLAYAGRRRGRAPWVVPVALVVAALPLATFLAQLVPWWRWGGSAYPLAVTVAALAVGGAAAAVARGRPVGGLAVVAGVTAAALTVDQLAGAPLQLAAPLGDSPLIAGRFHGVGNISFALLATGALLVAALAAGRQRSRTAAAVVAAAIGAAVVVVDGAPFLGDDAGGVLALVPAVGVLAVLVMGGRLAVRRLAAVLVATVVVAGGIAAYDYSRPATGQTHIGRFVGQVLHGGAGTVIGRKLAAALHSVGHLGFTLLVVAAVAYVVLERRRLSATVRAVPGLAAGGVAVAVAGVLGGALNDSGVAVPAFALALGLPALIALDAALPEPAPRRQPQPVG